MAEYDHKGIGRLWRLVDPLTVEQAACLLADCDPNDVIFDTHDGQPYAGEYRTSDVKTAFAAMMNAVNDGIIPATIRRNARLQGWDEDLNTGESFRYDESLNHGVIYCEAPDWSKTTVFVSDVRAWLERKGIRDGFFFPDKSGDMPDYLAPNHPRYSAKLAAAVKVWQAMEDENLWRGKGTLSAMQAWLESRYAELGLIWDGNMNRAGIVEVAKVANWLTKGGAPTTPGE